MQRYIQLCLILLLAFTSQQAYGQQSSDPPKGYFKNPILQKGPDPCMAQKDGWYYLMATEYALWSGHDQSNSYTQVLYLATMDSPIHISSTPVLISEPTYDWEKQGGYVNEGPEFLVHGDDLFVTYSASQCGNDSYKLGLLKAKCSSNLLDKNSWTKTPTPVFTKNPEGQAYAPGHNGFFIAPDGQNWIVYHANPGPGQQCLDKRSTRAQPFTFDNNGYPNFGKPKPLTQPIKKPLIGLMQRPSKVSF